MRLEPLTANYHLGLRAEAGLVKHPRQDACAGGQHAIWARSYAAVLPLLSCANATL